ncbi:hypothetical protein HFD88_003324 [Aspergillus terreus]|nr:hypothetical protein HFD88_003324 [Aspergillus terreus]
MIALLAAYYLMVLPFLANPLSHIPGPRLNQISNIPLAFLDLLLRRRDGVLKWHRIYGPVVAIAPTEVSVATLDATRQIYSSSNRYEKSNYFKHFEGYGPVHCSKALQSQCPEREMLSHLKRCQLWGPFRLRFPWFFRALPFAVQKLSVKLDYLKAEEELAKWSHKRVLQMLQSQDQTEHRSLVQVLTKHARRRRHPEELDRFVITPSFIAAEALDNINAAEATVSVTATYALYHLSRHRIWQERIRNELRQLSLPPGRHGLPSLSDVLEAPVTEACLLETTVSAAVTALHRKSQIFPNPEIFAPERWLDATPERRRALEAHLQPFGYGARVCLGKALATIEIKLLIAGIYLRYETRVPDITTEASMRQTSTHDAVPRGLRCDIQFRLVERD